MALKQHLFEIIVGTYEEYVLGYMLVEHNAEKVQLVQSFASHLHRASVRAVASKGKFLVSGGADESINIYDMSHRKDAGTIVGELNGTITCLRFTPDGSHLVATSEDGSIKFFRVGSWVIEKDFIAAHKGSAVNSVSIHPSGKIALTVGRDHTLRTWNLVKGRPAYTTNLASRCKNLDFVAWSPGGNYYVVNMNSKLEVFSMKTAGVIYILNFETKVTSVTFTQKFEDKGEILVGEASGRVSCHTLENGEELWHLTVSDRVKSLLVIFDYLVLGTSGGLVAIYSYNDTKEQPKFLTKVDTGCRITCLTAINPHSLLPIKKERDKPKENNDVKDEVKKIAVRKSIAKKRKPTFEVRISRAAKSAPDIWKVKCTVNRLQWRVDDSKMVEKV